MVTTVKVTGTPVLNDIITVADLKTFCRVDSADEDTLMDALRQTAISWCEQYCSIRLGDVAAIAYADAWAPLGQCPACRSGHDNHGLDPAARGRLEVAR